MATDFADDANWLAKGAEGMGAIAVAVFIMAARGTPISWPKGAGGFHTYGSVWN